MSAETESRAQSSDEDELFIPPQSYNSDDDRFLDAFHTENGSTEETSSKENDQHSEDERDKAGNQYVTAEPIVTTSQINATKRKKKAKKSKTSVSKKFSKIRSPRKDTDLELLDSLIAQNANTTWVDSPIKQESKTKPIIGKKLKDIMREKREAANSTLGKKVNHAFKVRETQPEKIRKFLDKRSKVIEREDGTKTTMVKVTREALERFKLATTTGNTEYLFNKYEERVANGKMTIDEAIAKATAGQDSSDDEDNKLLDDDDPMTKMLNREQLLSLLSEKQAGKQSTEKTMTMVDRCLATDDCLKGLLQLRDFESTMTDGELNSVAWTSMCKLVYLRFNSKIIIQNNKPITQPVKFYEEVLKQYVAQSMIQSITDMGLGGVFKKYDPAVKPLAVTCVQRNIADLFPKMEIVVEMSKLVANGFAPKDASQLDVFGTPLVAYGIFWSFAFNFNLFGAFFRAADGGYNYYWVVYDRITEDIDGIVGLPRKIVKETVNIGADEKDGSNSVHISHQTLREEGFDPQRTSVELGSSTSLETALQVDASVLNPEFRQNYTDEVDQLVHNNDTGTKFNVRYKEVKANETEFREKLASDDIADISIQSKPGEKQRICISFKNGASEEDKASLVQYVANQARQ